MRRAAFTLLALAALAGAARAETIFPDQARRNAGRAVTVRGVVAHVRDKGTVVWLDFGGNARDRLFVAIYPSAVGVFNDSVSLPGATVDVSGTVQLRNNRPWIEVREPSQLFIKK